MDNHKKQFSSNQNDQSVTRRDFMSRAIFSGIGLGIAPLALAGSTDLPEHFNSSSSSSSLPDSSQDVSKTVLLVNAHLVYPGMSEGKLNKSFFETAKAFLLSQSYQVLETRIADGYDAEKEVEKHLHAGIVILQTPVNWISTPWIYKKYVDDVFTSALKNQQLLSGDGRVAGDSSKQYGTGGKMNGRKFMISATWNAAEKDFKDKSQYLYGSKSPEDVFFNVTTNYRFSGYDILEGYNCFDVFHNQHIQQDLDNYPAHLKKVLEL